MNSQECLAFLTSLDQVVSYSLPDPSADCRSFGPLGSSECVVFVKRSSEGKLALLRASNPSLVLYTGEAISTRSNIIYVKDSRLALSLLLHKVDPVDHTGIHNTVVILCDCDIGLNATIDPYVVLGSRGLSPNFLKGEIIDTPHLGRLVIKDNVWIGPHTVVDRGVLTDTVIGNWARVGSRVHVAHGCIIGDYSCVITGSDLGGSVSIGKGCWIGLGSSIREGVTIGDGAVVGMGAVVTHDVEEDTVVVGNPAKKHNSKPQWALYGSRQI